MGACIVALIGICLFIVAVLLWRCIKRRRSRISGSQEGSNLDDIIICQCPCTYVLSSYLALPTCMYIYIYSAS